MFFLVLQHQFSGCEAFFVKEGTFRFDSMFCFFLTESTLTSIYSIHSKINIKQQGHLELELM